MNGFIEEICTQGPIMRDCVRKYREEDAHLIQQIVDTYHEKDMQKIILTGMGSSLYAMDSVKSYLTQHGICTLSFSAYELSHYQFQQIDHKTLVIAISQSGNSWEVIEVAKMARDVTTVVGIHNAPDCKLVQCCDIVLDMYAGKEVSISNKSHELTMLVLNMIAHALCGTMDDSFFKECDMVIDWCEDYLANYETYTADLYPFADQAGIYDFIANAASLATARQAALIYREGLHANTASWECADYAHGQYHGVKTGYLGIMFAPLIEEGTQEKRMFDHILSHDGKLLLITNTCMPPHEHLKQVRLPKVESCLTPLMESIVTDCLLGMLLGEDWYKGK